MNQQPEPTPELIALAKKFDALTRQVAQGFKKQLELARAEHNEEEIVRNQIKLGVLTAARAMFAGSYRQVLKSPPEGNWSEV
jgi:hypothetical protein